MTTTRRDAIAKTIGAAAATLRSQAQEAPAASAADEGQQLFLRLLEASDETVARILHPPSPAPAPPLWVRRGGHVAALVAAYCSPESAHHRSESLIPPLERSAQQFIDALDPAGLMDAGNLSSPPDTAFVVEATAGALHVARRARDPRLSRSQEILSRFLLTVGDALVTGGVHTPNHRWVVCEALARIHSLFPSEKYVRRIDDWLAEGIYQDADGLFPERSAIYGRVEANAFLTMARLLNRPALLDPVRKHLTATLYLMQPDGELETVHSRRQDQDRPIHVANYYVLYRHMAIRDNNPTYAAVARLIAERPGEGFVEGANPVLHFLEDSLLRKPLPAGGAIPSDYRRVFANSQLLRIRRGNRAASIYGGNDRPLGVASGLAHNPTFFSFRKGKAILNSVRMGGQFFSLGAFSAEGIRVEGDRTVLHQRLEAPYYEPLPPELRNPNGDYPLTPAKDGRFWSKLDFPRRSMSHVQILDQKVTIVEKPDAFELHIEITGRDRVPYTIELAFRPGGQFRGAIEQRNARLGGGAGQPSPSTASFLKEGMGAYQVGDDVIEFGPGQAAHEAINLSGHSYTAHGAVLRATGTCVYITGFTPFRTVIAIRGV